MHPNCDAVNEILRAAGLPGRVRMLDKAVTTARAAAEHLGCPVGAIANSLIFEAFLAGVGMRGQLMGTAASVSMREQLPESAASVGMREQLEEADAGAPLLIMTSGAHRVDMSKVGEQLGVQLRRASPAFVREHTVQPIGGVAPVGHPKPIRTIVDRSLAEFDELWAAGGIPHAIFPMTYDELIRLTAGVEADVS